MILSKKQKAKFAADGFLILKNIVPQNKVNDVFAKISAAQFLPSQHSNYGLLRKDKRFDHKSELSENIREVFDQYVSPLGAEILEIGNTYVDGQFSVMQTGRPASPGWHIDGTWIATDKNSLDGIPFFKLLVGIFLTDLMSPNRGNLMVSRGGHKTVADFFKKEGDRICATPNYAFEKLYEESIPQLETIFVNPGDAILAHALLPHTVSKNRYPRVNPWVSMRRPRRIPRLKSGYSARTPHKELKYILTAAAPLSPSLLSEILGDWGIRVIQGYGLSESTNFSCTMPTNLDMDLYKKIMFPLPSVGVSLAGVTIKVGEKDEPDVAGEITISSKSNCKGYWGRGASSSPMRQVMTGDIGYYKVIEGQRFYYLVGRAKEIINRGGEKISPIELEIELLDAGMVGEFAVITIPSDIYGEDVGLACAGDLDFAPLSKIPSYRRPKSIFRVTNLFYTPTGKLQRKKLSDFCNSGQAALIQT